MEIILSKANAIYDNLRSRLYEANRKEIVFSFLKNALISLIIFISAGFILVLLESILKTGRTFRTIEYFAYTISFFTTLAYLIITFTLKYTGVIKSFDLISFSRKAGRKFKNLRDNLPNSLSLFDSMKSGKDKSSVFSGELILANLEEVNVRSKEIDFSSFVVFKRLSRKAVILFTLIFLFTLSFSAFPGSLMPALNRLMNYNYDFIENEYGISFAITPGNTEVVRGEKLDVNIKLNFTKPGLKVDEINFITRQVSNDGVIISSDEKDLKVSADGSFNTLIENVNNQIIYYASYKKINSTEYKITIADYPVVKNFNVTLYPPAYTKLPSRQLGENEGDIFCLEGTKIYFNIKSNNNLKNAGMIFEEEKIEFTPNGDEATGSLIAENDGQYKFYLTNENGKENKTFKTYNLKVMPDRAPDITILEPVESSHTLVAEKEIMLRARISDDYGFSKLTLAYKKNSGNTTASANYTVANIPVQNLDATALEVPYLWYLNSLRLKPGETIEYFLEVTDNAGKSKKSDIRTLQYKSLADVLKNTEKNTKDIQKELKSALDNSKDLQKETQNLNKNSQELGLNEKQKELQNKLENLQQNMNSLEKKIEQSINELQQKNEISQKTLEQFMKLQEMFKKINTPELQEMLRKMQEAMKKNNPEEMKEALKNFKFDEEAFRKQIEKVLELMKKIENLQKLGQLTQKLDDMKNKQEELKKETENTKKEDQSRLNTLSNKQKDIEEQMNEFRKELKELSESLKNQKEDLGSKELDNISKKLDQKKTQEKMQKSSNDLFKGNKKQSEDTQEDILKDLNEMNEQMQDALENAMDTGNETKKMMEKMGQIKKDIEKLSEDQQDLKEKTQDTEKKDSKEFQNRKKEQGGLQQRLTKSIDDVMNLTKNGVKITPELGKELGNAYNKMDKAGNELGNENKENATGNQGKAKESLDNAAKQLGDMMDKMGKQGKDGKDGKDGNSGKGRLGQLMQQLAELIGRQQGVNGQNGQTGQNGKTGKDGKGNNNDNLSQEQRESMEKMKLEQEQISKSLEQLQEEFEKEKQRSGEKLLGNLDEIRKDMQEVIKDMSENRVTDKTIEKQNRILSRLLDAQLSQRERDFEQKRESKPGSNVVRNSPPEIILSGPNSINAFKEDFLRLQKEGYTEDYEELITKYLKELSKIK